MKLIVVSMDALVWEDLEVLLQKPTFQTLFSHGAKVDRLRSIYPTLTYPCHTTMVTGCYPHRHGVTNNTEDLIGVQGLPWLFQHENVRCGDLFDACHKAGLTTASVGWPVTGCHRSIDYLLDECWPAAGATKFDELWTGPAVTPRLQTRCSTGKRQACGYRPHLCRRFRPGPAGGRGAHPDGITERIGG